MKHVWLEKYFLYKKNFVVKMAINIVKMIKVIVIFIKQNNTFTYVVQNNTNNLKEKFVRIKKIMPSKRYRKGQGKK